MPIVDAVATGNYSNAALTFGGVTPQPGDTVRTNGFSITLDVPVSSINFLANSGGLIAGQTQIDANGGLLICDNCTLDYRGTAAAAGLQLTYSSGEFRWTGSATNNSPTGSRYAIRLSLSGTAICRLGSVRGGPSNYTIGAAIGSSGSGVTVYVDQATGGSGLEAFGFGSEFSSGNYLCYITNAIGGTFSNAAGVGVSQSGSSRFYIENAIPSSAPGLWIGPSVANVSAWVTNASGSAGGNGSVSSRMPGVRFLSTGLNNFCRVKTLIFGVLGQSPIDGIIFLDPDPTNTVQYRLSDGSTKTLADPATFADSPVPADVRSGVSYNNGNNAGTCAVPLASQTAAGVPVDDTTGTAVLTQAQLEATIAATISPPGQYRLTISALDGVDLVPGVGLSIVGVAGTSRTTGTGEPVSIDLDAGEYLVRVSVPFGFAPVADVPVELPGPDDDVELSIDLESLTVTPPTAGNVCRVTLRVADEADAPWIDLPVFATLVSGPGVGLTLHANRGEPVLTDADGIATLDRLQGQVYDITAQRPDGVEITIRRQLPNAANADLSTLTVPS